MKIPVVAFLIVSLPARASGLTVIGDATKSALRGILGITPTAGSTIPDPTECSCDSCVSAHRKTPTAVSDTKCVPSIRVPMGSTCIPKGKFPAETRGTDVPYQSFCVCACQPFLRAESKFVVSAEPPSCVDFSSKEKNLVDYPGGKRDKNCEDPKLPTQMKQNKMNMDDGDLFKMARTAATPPPRPAPKKLREQAMKVKEALSETKRQYEAAVMAHETARMLAKDPVVQQNVVGWFDRIW